jgi:ABC-type transport system substrate-binding protein
VNDFPGHKYDVAKAKQLLSEAGQANGFKTRIIIMPALVDKDAMTAVQANLAAVGIQADLETPDGGGYTAMRFGGGWTNGFLAQHTRALATFNITYNFYFPENTQQFPSLVRPGGFLQKLDTSLRTAAPEPALGQELSKMLVDDLTIIPVYYVAEMYILQPNVRDSGYNEWSAGTINTPEKAWLSK